MVPPPTELPAPSLWGNEQAVRQRFAHGISKLSLTWHKAVFDYPFTPREVVGFLPSSARSSVTFPLTTFATQMLAPSKAIAPGNEPTVKVPIT
jgi:hypothetical protein